MLLSKRKTLCNLNLTDRLTNFHKKLFLTQSSCFYIISSNIDTRIQQAELEYQLGREELNLLSLMEETNKHKCRLEEIELHTVQNENNTLYK